MDVGIETYKELCHIYGNALIRKQEVTPAKIEGDFYVTIDGGTDITPESWVDAIPLISAKYLLGPARYAEEDDVPSELEDVANKLIEAGKGIKDLRLSCALNDYDRRDMMVEVRHDNIVPLMLFLG